MRFKKINNVVVRKQQNETCFFIPVGMTGSKLQELKETNQQTIKNL